MARLLAITVIFSALSGLFAASSAHAELSGGATPIFKRLYADINFVQAGARHSDLDFYPGFVSLAGGAWIRRGVGIDVFVDEGLYEGDDGEFEFEITNASGIAGRFQSPPKNGFFAYVVLGIVHVRVVQDETREGDVTRSVVQNYEGGRISVGIGQQIRGLKSLIVTAEYRNYFVDTELQMDALSVGLRLSFR